MKSIYICFSLKSADSSIKSNEELEKEYQTVYKPIAKFLFSHPDFYFSFCFSGNQIEYFKRRRKEFINILKELIDRKQVEIIGGGYFNPIFPIISTVDRNSQIDILSSEIRQTFGKRPRGIYLFKDCWDSSLINNLQVSGIEYVLLNTSVLEVTKQKYIPLAVSMMGKSVEVFPYSSNIFHNETTTPEFFCNEINSLIVKAEKNDEYSELTSKRIVNITFDIDNITDFISSKWFDKFDKYIKSTENVNIELTTNTLYKKISTVRIPSHLNNVINYQELPVKEDRIPVKKTLNYSIYDYLDNSKNIKSLYDRTTYINILINQYKKDKMRKKAAREKLWQAQNGNLLIPCCSDDYINSLNRQKAYKFLMEADKILREDNSFKENIVSFDYNGDGRNDYICSMNNYFAYITPYGGSIQDFEVTKNSGNYCDSEEIADFSRGFFNDFIFTKDEFENYKDCFKSKRNLIKQYNEIKFNQNHKDIQLENNTLNLKFPIQIKKRFLINSNGMSVQYIIRNNGNKTLNLIFAVESIFSNTCSKNNNCSNYSIDLISNNQKNTIADSEKQLCNNINFIRITNKDNSAIFVFEPNEACNYFSTPRKLSDNTSSLNSYVSNMFWEINLEPDREVEKNINFTVQVK